MGKESTSSNRVSAGDATLDALGKLALHALTLSLRSETLVVRSFGVYVGAVVKFEENVGGRVLRAESRWVLTLALDVKGLNLMVGDHGQISGRLKSPEVP
jgi:hypothetical protein